MCEDGFPEEREKKLPETAFTAIQEYLQDIYVDIDDMDNLQEKMDNIACSTFDCVL